MDVPDWLDLFVERLLEGVSIPGPYKKKKKTPLAPLRETDLLPIAFSTGRAAYSCTLTVDGVGRAISFTQFGLRVWVEGDWNRDPPTMEGDVVRRSIAKVLEEIRVRSFLSPMQARWLVDAFDDGGSGARLPDLESDALAQWVGELRSDHALIEPDDAGARWMLTPYGAEVRNVLLRSGRRAGDT